MTFHAPQPQHARLTPPRQFYKLSKSNHPDLHPNDPTKSKRFVAISEAPNLRPRFPPLNPNTLLRPPQRPPRLLLLPQHSSRRAPGLRPKQTAHAIQRPAALLLRLRRLGRPEREALATRDQRPRRHLRPSDRPRRDRAGRFHAGGGRRHSAFRPAGPPRAAREDRADAASGAAEGGEDAGRSGLLGGE
jgi:hypothetical protein